MYVEKIKGMLADSIESYEYYSSVPHGDENMAVFTKPGKKEQFLVVLRQLNMVMSQTKRKKDGKDTECFTFTTQYLPEFKTMISDIVDSRAKGNR
jgi:hypothetical protein